VKFGGGKTIRDGMAQSQRTRNGPWAAVRKPVVPWTVF
jgi:urease alpha subunit